MRRLAFSPRACAWALILACAGAFAQGKVADSKVVPNVKEGLWHIGVAIEVTPQATGPTTGPTETQRCMIPEDMKSLLAMPAGANCTVQQQKLTRDALTWRLSCTQAGYTAVANGQIDFRGTRLEGRIVSETLGTGVRMTTLISGRHVGACVPVNRPSEPQPQPPRKGERLRSYQ